MPWLLEHTALLLSVRSRLPSGLTPWATIRGRPFGQKLIGFGEVVLWKLPTKGPASQPEGNMGARWSTGVFVGYNRSSNTFIVMTEDGKKAVRSINRYPEQTRWNAEAISNIKATPWSEREVSDPVVRFQEPVVDRGGVEVAAPGALKRFRLNAQDLQTHGYTDGCPQCGHIQRYGRGRAGGVHSDPCRERLLTAIGETILGRKRLDDYEERVNRAMAEQIERVEAPLAGGIGTDRKWPSQTGISSGALPGLSGTGMQDDGATPGAEPAARLSTQLGVRRQAAEKTQGPRGLNEAGVATGSAEEFTVSGAIGVRRRLW